MFQVARIHDGSGGRIVACHIVGIGIGFAAGDSTHDRHMVESLRNLLKTMRHQYHGTV